MCLQRDQQTQVPQTPTHSYPHLLSNGIVQQVQRAGDVAIDELLPRVRCDHGLVQRAKVEDDVKGAVLGKDLLDRLGIGHVNLARDEACAAENEGQARGVRTVRTSCALLSNGQRASSESL